MKINIMKTRDNYLEYLTSLHEFNWKYDTPERIQLFQVVVATQALTGIPIMILTRDKGAGWAGDDGLAPWRTGLLPVFFTK